MYKSIELDIEPKPKKRPRFYRGIVYTDKETQIYEKFLRDSWVAKHGTELAKKTCPLKVEMRFSKKLPKSVKKSREWITKPDVDNLAKCIDALNGVAFADDKQIVELKAIKEPQTPTSKDKVFIKIEYKEG